MKVKFKFVMGLLMMMLMVPLFFSSCQTEDDPIPITYILNSGSDDIAVFVYDRDYRHDNKCLPDQITRVNAENGVYEYTSFNYPGDPIVMYVVFPKDYKGEAKAVIESNGTILHRSNAAEQGSAIFVGRYRYKEIIRKLSWNRSICNNPLILEWGDDSYDTVE